MTLLQPSLQKLQNDNYEKIRALLTTVYSSIINNIMINEETLKNWQKTFGTRVKNFRKFRGYTQSDLAKKAGLTKSYVGNIEQMKRPGISIDTLLRICLALNCYPNELIIE